MEDKTTTKPDPMDAFYAWLKKRMAMTPEERDAALMEEGRRKGLKERKG